MRLDPIRCLGILTCMMFATSLPATAAGGDAAPAPPREGDRISYDRIDELRPWLPPEFWSHRDFFFYEGMALEIGPAHRDYAPAAAYLDATTRFAHQARLGPDDSLEGYVAGQPFPIDDVDCRRDPRAGAKIMWDFDYQWHGDGAATHFYYSYWDRGEQLPLFFEGTSKTIQLSHRVEPAYRERGGDLFRGEHRKNARGIEVTAPFDARGTALLSYRYKSSDRPPAEAQNDDTWVYVPSFRRVRRVSTAQRTDAVVGTDFTFDDLFSFDGIVPQYEWTCLREAEILAPTNTRVRAYPYQRNHDFGPYGLSYADDRWELRHALVVRMVPKNADHPYQRKDLYLDRQTLVPLYSFAYDRKGELWKIIWHNKRWSEDDLTGDDWYVGWEGVETPRDLRVVSDVIVNVQTGTGNRIEIWDNHGMPLGGRGRVRAYINVGRLDRRH